MEQGKTLPRIIHLIDSNIDTAFFNSIARRHDRDRFPVTIGSIAPAGALQPAMRALGIPTFSLRARGHKEYSRALFRLTGMLRRTPDAILHAHCFDPTFLGLLAARLARVPFVFTRHHSDHHIRIGKKWHIKMDSTCARKADHVIAVSNATKQILVEIENVPANQITVVYNGMEPLRPPTKESVEAVRRELQLPVNVSHSTPVLLMLARLHEEKGHRVLFDAIPQITARMGPIRVLLGGDGPQRAELEAEVQKRGLGESICFLGRRSEVAELISLSSLLVLPSLAESFGFVSLEAMSLGKPVVASAVGGTPEVVQDGQTGLLVPPLDAPALAAAVCRVLQNPSLAKTLGEAGVRRAEFFSFERMIRGYEAVYEQLPKGKQRP